MDLTGLGYEDDEKWLRVVKVRHRIWEIEKSHIGHQIGLCVEEV
jgi:hypothetical protein